MNVDINNINDNVTSSQEAFKDNFVSSLNQEITPEESIKEIPAPNKDNCHDPYNLPLLIFVHGGGWCFSSVQHRNSLASQFAIRHNLEVVSINHSLSPE